MNFKRKALNSAILTAFFSITFSSYADNTEKQKNPSDVSDVEVVTVYGLLTTANRQPYWLVFNY